MATAALTGTVLSLLPPTQDRSLSTWFYTELLKTRGHFAKDCMKPNRLLHSTIKFSCSRVKTLPFSSVRLDSITKQALCTGTVGQAKLSMALGQAKKVNEVALFV